MGCCGRDDGEIQTCSCASGGGAPCEPRPNPLVMALRFAAFGLGLLVAFAGMIREGKLKHLWVWLGAWSVFLTIARYIICSRCEGYGQMCYSYYIGKYTSLVFPGVEGKDVRPIGFGLEAACLGAIFWVPALAMRGNRKLFKRYLAIMQLVAAGQFFHACRWCAANSTHEWKNRCPAHRTWKKILGIPLP